MPFAKTSPIPTPASAEKLGRLEPGRNPRHVAIILDGNGRWARQRGLRRSEGHRAGAENLNRMLDFFLELKIDTVSLYTFSTENWKRPSAEVRAIWNLFHEFFDAQLERCLESGVRVITSGELSRLSGRIRRRIEEVVEQTSHNTNLTANFCVNYGSQDEILRAAQLILEERLAMFERGDKRKARTPIKKKEFESRLYTADLPPVDLLVRPGGESRISNFLLWQSAYAEIYVTETLWPDFGEENLLDALLWYQGRDRRFGGLSDDGVSAHGDTEADIPEDDGRHYE